MTKVKTITNNIVSDDYIRRTIFKFIIGALIALSLAYFYLIGSVTFNVLARKSLENTMLDIGSKVGNLELSYLSLSNGINQTFANSIGFVDSQNTIIVTRATDRVAIR